MTETMPSEEAAVQPSVLIVDDEPAVRGLVRAIIEHLGIPCRIFEAANSETAIEVARNADLDLALLDIVMPGSTVSGVGVCQELCKNPRTKVVIVSGNAIPSILEVCRSLGAVDCWQKPFSLRDIQVKLKRWLCPNADPASLFE